MLHCRRFPGSAIVSLCLESISLSVFRHQGAFSFYLGTDVIAFWKCTAQLMRGTELLDALKQNWELHVPVPTAWVFRTRNFCMFMQFSELATVIYINSMNQRVLWSRKWIRKFYFWLWGVPERLYKPVCSVVSTAHAHGYEDNSLFGLVCTNTCLPSQ